MITVNITEKIFNKGTSLKDIYKSMEKSFITIPNIRELEFDSNSSLLNDEVIKNINLFFDIRSPSDNLTYGSLIEMKRDEPESLVNWFDIEQGSYIATPEWKNIEKISFIKNIKLEKIIK